MERVRRHVRQCRDCGDQLRLTEECLRWLDAIKTPVAPGDAALAAIRARLVAEVRATEPLQDVASLSRLCLGPRSFAEIARRLNRLGAAAQPPPEVAAPMFAAFLGRKALTRPARAH